MPTNQDVIPGLEGAGYAGGNANNVNPLYTQPMQHEPTMLDKIIAYIKPEYTDPHTRLTDLESHLDALQFKSTQPNPTLNALQRRSTNLSR